MSNQKSRTINRKVNRQTFDFSHFQHHNICLHVSEPSLCSAPRRTITLSLFLTEFVLDRESDTRPEQILGRVSQNTRNKNGVNTVTASQQARCFAPETLPVGHEGRNETVSAMQPYREVLGGTEGLVFARMSGFFFCSFHVNLIQ